MNFWGNKASASVIGTPNNQIMYSGTPFIRTYRTYIKPREYGDFRWSFWFCNTVDTYPEGCGSGGTAICNETGGKWHIECAYIADGGTIADGKIVKGTQHQVTYEGITCKDVFPSERFWSDPVQLYLPEGHYLCFTWTLSVSENGKSIPFAYQSQYSCFAKDGSHAKETWDCCFLPLPDIAVLPNLITYERKVEKRIGFLGDSITQGFSTVRDGYGFWVAKIAEGLGNDYSIWNLGSGWGHASDAASDGAWLYKAKQNDEVVICLGVNDIRLGRTDNQILNDLDSITKFLKFNKSCSNIIICTVPPFNFRGCMMEVWYKVNEAIRSNTIKNADRIFDLATVLLCPHSNECIVNPNYDSGDGHPNDEGGRAVARAFLSWY